VKSFSSDALDTLERGDGIDAGAVAVYSAPDPILVWGGYGDIVLGGDTFKGIGDSGLVTVTGGAVTGAAQNIELTLSGIDPANLELYDATTIRRVPVVLWRLLFDASGANLLDASIYARGRLDQAPREYAPDGTATIRALAETAAMGLGRSRGRRRSDADQRMISATDGAKRAVSYAGKKTLYWGGQIPERAGTALKK
jgi:hypothetical protein